MSSLKFGTSGLRGLVTDLSGWPSHDYAGAFLRSVGVRACPGRELLIGRDLRGSSAGIAATVAAAAAEAAFRASDCGTLPTPALALEAARRGACAVMVTGSHIPDDRNGLKFYRPDGEIDKADEAAILACLRTPARDAPRAPDVPVEPDAGATERYLRRYEDAFGPESLAGLRVVVYQQSSVARDILAGLLSALGAEAVPVGRASGFVPIDTEAHRPEDVAYIRRTMAEGGFDALVTTDGDADRPLVADSTGRIVRGDVLGLVTARYLRADAVVVPVTAGSAVDRPGRFRLVLRTRVGSPYVIAGMAQAQAEGAGTTVGYEANGGFLLGSEVALPGGALAPLPTRDAALPILATLAAMREAGTSLAGLVADLRAGETASDRLREIPPERSGAFLRRLKDAGFRRDFLGPVGAARAVDEQDGVRMALDGGRTVHFRASGNAPELRCYAEAGTADEAEGLVRWGLAAATAALAVAA